ncbi:MAG: hypothetical protein K9L79_15910 [Methylobacter tundripaludum]|nr:hypothetical protein [Methylobacter tundripaludum]
MSTKITFFPVGNGDMTLIELDDAKQTKILIDMNIRESADDTANEDYFDVASELRSRLNNDSKGRPYVVSPEKSPPTMPTDTETPISAGNKLLSGNHFNE